MSLIDGVSAGGAVNAVLAQREVYQQEQVQVSMLKKSLEQTDAVAPVDASKLPSHLGQNVNTTA